MPERHHIIPQGDYKEHEVSLNCWCKPEEDEIEPSVIIHHSMDGRELVEDGRKLLQ